MKLIIETTTDKDPRQTIELEMSGGSPYYQNVLINGKMYTIFIDSQDFEDIITIEPTE